MANTAVLVGNSQYSNLRELPCCHADLVAMKELLEATGKYSKIEVIEDAEADELKSRLRLANDENQSIEELFFYFTGHGCQQEDEYYCCATNFDSKQPNVTGLSSNELHTLLRQANANLVVKVIDSCNSGTLLVKSNDEHQFQTQQKHGFNNLIQISSCLQSQNALTGESISIFTEKFRAAALRKRNGAVFYTDINNVLRDEYYENNEQTPFFVFQATGREKFVDDAKRLNSLRDKLTGEDKLLPLSEGLEDQALTNTPSLQDLLEETEKIVATPDKINSFVKTFFDNLIEKVTEKEFPELFDLNITEYSDFDEPTSDAFIIRILSKQSRPDEFVTASIQRERVSNPFARISTVAFLGMFGDDQKYREVYDLRLNCKMPRVQMKISLTPKYHSLKQLIIVVTCAPSLENCYVFEIGTQHSLIDFGKFNDEGDEVVRRWYKLHWAECTDGVVEKIALKLDEVVREHLERTEQRLIED